MRQFEQEQKNVSAVLSSCSAQNSSQPASKKLAPSLTLLVCAAHALLLAGALFVPVEIASIGSEGGQGDGVTVSLDMGSFNPAPSTEPATPTLQQPVQKPVEHTTQQKPVIHNQPVEMPVYTQQKPVQSQAQNSSNTSQTTSNSSASSSGSGSGSGGGSGAGAGSGSGSGSGGGSGSNVSSQTCSVLTAFNKRYPGTLSRDYTVTLTISRSGSGAVTSVSLSKGSGDTLLDRFAMKSARQARFKSNPACDQRTLILPIKFQQNS